MNESLAFSLGLSLAFFALGHACLHHFVDKEHPGKLLPLVTALLPWPGKGITVAAIALLAALFFFLLAFKVSGGPSSLKATLVFLLFASPLVAHFAWLLSCCRKVENTWFFVPGSPSQTAVRWVLLIPAVATLFFMLLRLRGDA